jgi:hypothetical protein
LNEDLVKAVDYGQKNLSAVGNNTRKIGHLVAPWIRVENVKSLENDESFLWHKVSRFKSHKP